MAALLAAKYQPGTSTPLVAGTMAPPSASAMPAHTAAKPSATAKPSGTGHAATRVITGSVASTAYGPMQVQTTMTGARITNVTVVQQTNAGAYSSQLDSVAIPKLTSETLAAQSAKVDAVSGASYTSQGYIQSLQSALDQRTA
jgi:uncharacterized protein with FMN-binding domain